MKNNYFKDLPSWAKGVVVVGGLAVTYIFLNQIIKKLRQDAELKKAQEKIANDKKELQKLIDQGQPTSFPKSVYDGMALAILDQFQGCDYSLTSPIVSTRLDLTTSGQKVYDTIMKLNNDRDFLELVDSWGIQTYDACGPWTGNEENKTLYEAVANELGSAEIEFINKALANRGITRRFS